MSTSVDLDAGIVALWNSSGLDAIFKDFWSAQNQTEFISLLDCEARPAQPHPYCVFHEDAGSTITRMSGQTPQTGPGRMENREIPLEFHVHAKETTGSTKSAKQIASNLAESIIQIFGGHPTVVPQIPTLAHGNVLRVQYQSDVGTEDDDQVWQWIIRYKFLVDVPVAA